MKGFWYLIGFATLIITMPAAAQTQPPPVKPAATAPALGSAFPQGASVGFLDLERVASLTREGKAANAKLDQLRSQKRAEVDERGKQVEALQTRLSQTESVLSADSRLQLQRQYDRAQVDLQRFTQDAQAEVQSTQEQTHAPFHAASVSHRGSRGVREEALGGLHRRQLDALARPGARHL